MICKKCKYKTNFRRNNTYENAPDNNANLNTEKIFELHKIAWKKLRVGNTGEAWILYERRKY